MGFLGFAEATTLIGEVTVPPSVGLEMLSGKSLEPGGGGTWAEGAGSGLVCGDQVIGTNKKKKKLGWVGAGVVGVVGGVVLTGDLPVLTPQPSEIRIKEPQDAARRAVKTRRATWGRAADTLIFLQTSACGGHLAARAEESRSH